MYFSYYIIYLYRYTAKTILCIAGDRRCTVKKEGEEMFKKKESSAPKQVKAINPMLILVAFLVVAAIATYLVPAGTFDRVANDVTGYSMVDPGSYHHVAQNPIKIFDFFMAIPNGLAGSGGLIFFILIVGGALQVIQATGAIDIGLKNLIKKFAGKENLLLIAILLTFGLLSCFAATSEEFLAFMPLIYMVCLGLGFDSMVAAFLVLGASSIGYCGGMTNAYTVGVAQTIAELPMFSGIGYRAVVFVVFEIVSIIWLCAYTTKIRKNPEKSLMYEIDSQYRTALDLSDIPPMTTRHKLVLLTFILGIAAMVWGILARGFYLTEMGAVFIIMTVAAGIVGGLDGNQICNEFVEGTKSLLWVGLVMGLCKGVTNVLTDANIIDTVINVMASLLHGLPQTISACAMFAVQDIINFVIPSGSGQAAVTMPLMVPLGDLLGINRQLNVLAFQFGDSLSNMVTPAGAKLMAGIAMCHIPYRKWLKFFLPCFALWCVTSFALLIIATLINYGPF